MIRKARVCLLTFGAVVGSSLAGAAPNVSPTAAQSYRAEHEPEWLRRVAGSESRLFFSDSGWKEIKERINGLQGPGLTLKKEFFERCRQIVSQPLPVYRTPEQRLNKKDYLNATLFVSLSELWERDVADDIFTLALATKIGNDPRNRAYLHDLVLAACKFDTWGRPRPEAGEFGPNTDLACSHMAYGISVAYDWDQNIFTEAEKELIRATIATRVHDLLHAAYTQGWGASIAAHNWRNTAGLGFAGLAFLGRIPEAGEWLSVAVQDYLKVVPMADADGSSFTGVAYWSSELTANLPFISAVKGVTELGGLLPAEHFRNAIDFRLHTSVPGFDGAVRWGDGVDRDFYGPQHILYLCASIFGDGRGQYLADHLPYPPWGSSDTLALSLLWYDPMVQPKVPDRLDNYFPDWQEVSSRTGWGDRDYFLSVKAGPNNRAHSHLDSGGIALNVGGIWFLTSTGMGLGDRDAGYWDFEGKRWTYFSCAAESVSTLLINGRNQRFDRDAGGKFDSVIQGVSAVWADIDLTRAYWDANTVRRRVFHRRGDYVLVLDSVDAPTEASVEWLAQVPPALASLRGNSLELAGNKTRVRIDSRFKDVNVVGGRLDVRPLDPGTGFALRVPTSPHLDAAEPQATYALHRSGKQVRFAVLLQPTIGGAEPQKLSAAVKDAEAGRVVRIDGPGWTDTITLLERPEKIALGSTADAFAVAETTAIRENSANRLVSVVGIGARRVSIPGFSMEAAAPAEFAWENLDGHASSLVLAKDTRAKFGFNSGYQMRDSDGKTVATDGEVDLAAGRYLIGVGR